MAVAAKAIVKDWLRRVELHSKAFPCQLFFSKQAY